jgi:hypothetical protein
MPSISEDHRISPNGLDFSQPNGGWSMSLNPHSTSTLCSCSLESKAVSSEKTIEGLESIVVEDPRR